MHRSTPNSSSPHIIHHVDWQSKRFVRYKETSLGVKMRVRYPKSPKPRGFASAMICTYVDDSFRIVFYGPAVREITFFQSVADVIEVLSRSREMIQQHHRHDPSEIVPELWIDETMFVIQTCITDKRVYVVKRARQCQNVRYRFECTFRCRKGSAEFFRPGIILVDKTDPQNLEYT